MVKPRPSMREMPFVAALQFGLKWGGPTLNPCSLTRGKGKDVHTIRADHVGLEGGFPESENGP